MFTGVTVCVLLALSAAEDARPPVDPTRCVEDESMVRYDEDTVLCFHVEGDGWRVLEFPPALPAQPVPWEGLAIS